MHHVLCSDHDDIGTFRGLMLAGAVLVGTSTLLLSLLPEVPTDVAALSDWVEEGSALAVWSDELRFFAILCWWAGGWGVFTTALRGGR